MWKIIYLPTGELVGDYIDKGLLYRHTENITNNFKTKSAAKHAINNNLTIELVNIGLDNNNNGQCVVGDNLLCILWEQKISSDWFLEYNKKYNHLFDVVNIKKSRGLTCQSSKLF